MKLFTEDCAGYDPTQMTEFCKRVTDVYALLDSFNIESRCAIINHALANMEQIAYSHTGETRYTFNHATIDGKHIMLRFDWEDTISSWVIYLSLRYDDNDKLLRTIHVAY